MVGIKNYSAQKWWSIEEHEAEAHLCYLGSLMLHITPAVYYESFTECCLRVCTM